MHLELIHNIIILEIYSIYRKQLISYLKIKCSILLLQFKKLTQ